MTMDDTALPAEGSTDWYGHYTALDETARANETAIGDLGTAAESDTGDFATAAQGTKADTAVQPDDLVVRRIFETALGVWTADAPAGRSDYIDSIEFVGVTDPTDATNGINTPGNIIAGDRWIETTDYVA